MLRKIELTACVWVAFSLCAPAQTTSNKSSLTPRELFYNPPPAAGGDSRPKLTSTPLPDQAKLHAKSLPPWKLRYRILQRRPDGLFQGIDVTKAVFHSGYQLRVRIEANQDTFLSILEHGSTGRWTLLFPSSKMNKGQDRVPRFQVTEIPPPPSPGFSFDEHAGQEDVYLIVSRTHVDIGPLIASLNHTNVDGPEKSSIEADLMRKIARNETSIGSRDLVFEQAEEDTPDGFREIAFYVGRVATSPDSQPGVVHFILKHPEDKAK